MNRQIALITPIGSLVLDEACHQAAAWLTSGYDAQMSANVSVAQFTSSEFVEDVCSVLERHGLPGEMLILEITGSMLMRDVPQTIATLSALNSLGVKIAIDDFGTGIFLDGLSPPIPHRFAQDRSQLHHEGIGGSPGDRDPPCLGPSRKGLELETLAEGIEEQSQVARLQHEDCDSGQGFIFAKQLPAEDVSPFLDRRATEAREALSHGIV
jgi:EAL domain-containing protein (putative c-di-GMP-specific phosphodiesterase class I)